jgi:hypothetical protein
MEMRAAFFDELANTLERWTDSATKALTQDDARLGWTNAADDFLAVRNALRNQGVNAQGVRSVVYNTLRAYTHGVLLIIDGATQLAEHGQISIVDEEGNSLGEALHDYFTMYLAERK